MLQYQACPVPKVFDGPRGGLLEMAEVDIVAYKLES